MTNLEKNYQNSLPIAKCQPDQSLSNHSLKECKIPNENSDTKLRFDFHRNLSLEAARLNANFHNVYFRNSEVIIETHRRNEPI